MAQEDDYSATDFDKLNRFERGGGAEIRGELETLLGRAPLLADFDGTDVARLAAYVELYRAPAGETIIREGDAGDFMLLITCGEVDIVKQGRRHGQAQRMAVVGAGTSIGEMSMIDGEPRFATCVALEPTSFAVLTRERMKSIVEDEPRLASKILAKIVALLSARLRHTSAQLMRYMEV